MKKLSNGFKRPTDYEWLYSCASDSRISARDIAVIYGIKPDRVHFRVTEGAFPKHDCMRDIGWYKGTFQWYAKTVIAAIKQDIIDTTTVVI